MKKIFASAAAAALLLSGSVAAIPTVALAQSGSESAKFCQWVASVTPYSVGECQSYYRTYPVRLCQELKDADVLQYYGLKNQGECVSLLRSFL